MVKISHILRYVEEKTRDISGERERIKKHDVYAARQRGQNNKKSAPNPELKSSQTTTTTKIAFPGCKSHTSSLSLSLCSAVSNLPK